MPWRPARIKDLPPEAAHVLNQLMRETHGRIDDVVKTQRPRIAGTSTLVFGTVGANSCVEVTALVKGAHTGGVAFASPAQGLTLGSGNLSWSAYVSAQDQVKVRVCNHTAAGVAVNTIPWNIQVLV